MVDCIETVDAEFAREIADFYAHCLKFGRIQEREQI